MPEHPSLRKVTRRVPAVAQVALQYLLGFIAGFVFGLAVGLAEAVAVGSLHGGWAAVVCVAAVAADIALIVLVGRGIERPRGWGWRRG